MIILGIDCAGKGASIALIKDKTPLVVVHEAMDRGQDARLIPLIQDVLAEGKIHYQDLDRIVVTRGPGSFTGVRIALATARSLGIASEKPVIGIDRFTLYRAMETTYSKGSSKDLLVILDSRREELFYAHYKNGTTEPQIGMKTIAEIKELKNVIVRSDCLDLLGAPWSDDVDFDKEATVEAEIQAACQLAAEGEVSNPQYAPTPLYIRPPDVTFSSSKKKDSELPSNKS